MESPRSGPSLESTSPRLRLKLPPFINDDDVGLGDVIKRATSAVGIRPCGGCARRAERLNAWVGFSSRRPRG